MSGQPWMVDAVTVRVGADAVLAGSRDIMPRGWPSPLSDPVALALQRAPIGLDCHGWYRCVVTSHRGRHLANALSPGIVLSGLQDAYRDAFADRQLAWASPAVALVGAFIGFYGLGLLVTFGSLGTDLPAIAIAVAMGLMGLLVGLGVGWSRPVNVEPEPASTAPRTGVLGFALVAAGLIALVLYFVRIGDIPLFRPGLEQARVDASEEGGAALRVLAMLAIPGCWMVIAWAVHRRNRRGSLIGASLVLVVATGWLLTGNRAPAFQTVEASIIASLLTYGFVRLPPRRVALLTVVALTLVIAAGAFGGLRLASRVTTYGPPAPNPPTPDYVQLTQIAIKGYLRVPVQNLRYTIEAVPERIGWRLGSTYLLPLVTILPGKQLTFDAQLKIALDQRYAGGGTVPSLLGESYANFGPVGWFVVPTIVAFVLTRVYRRAIAARSPAWWALYAYAIVHLTGAFLSGLSIASIFPWEAYGVLALPILWLRLRHVVATLTNGRGTTAPSPTSAAQGPAEDARSR
jgi:oligosaccharide repeat unit polymerase